MPKDQKAPNPDAKAKAKAKARTRARQPKGDRAKKEPAASPKGSSNKRKAK